MPHHNSVFHAVLKQVAWKALDEAVERHGAADCARSFSFRSQVIAMLYAQLSGAASLRDIEAGLQSHRAAIPRSDVAEGRQGVRPARSGATGRAPWTRKTG